MTLNLLKNLKPTAGQIFVCVALSMAIQALVFQSLVIPHLIGTSSLTPFLNTGKQLELSQLNNFSIVRLAVQGIFWAIVGLCAYIVYLGIINAIVEARNELVVSTEFANKGSGKNRVKGMVVQGCLLIVLILALWLTAQFGFNWWFGLTTQLVLGGVSWTHFLGAVASVAGFALNLYLLWVLAETTITADRYSIIN